MTVAVCVSWAGIVIHSSGGAVEPLLDAAFPIIFSVWSVVTFGAVAEPDLNRKYPQVLPESERSSIKQNSQVISADETLAG